MRQPEGPAATDRAAEAEATGVEDAPTGQEHSVAAIIDDVRLVLEKDRVQVSDIVAQLGTATFAPLLMLPALLVVSPLSGIPGFSSICGICIALVSVQMILNRSHVWLPQWIMRREVKGQPIRAAFERIGGVARWLDRVTRRRLSAIVTPPLLVLPQIVCLLCGAAMPFLELLPFTSSLLGATVSVMAVAMVTRDGLLALLGLGIIALTVMLGIGLLN